MKTSLLTLVSVIIFLASCSNNQKSTEASTIDTISKVDTVIKDTSDTVKDTIAVKKSDRQTDEERDQKIMDDILKKRKTMK